MIIALFFCACAEDMEEISQITKFRVMAVQADPPEIKPGQGTTLNVLIADPAESRDVSILWLTCAGSFSPDDEAGSCEPIWMPQISTATKDENDYHYKGTKYRIPFTPPDILDNLEKDEEYLSVSVIVVLCAGGTIAGFDGSFSGFDTDMLDTSSGFPDFGDMPLDGGIEDIWDEEADPSESGESVPDGAISNFDEMCEGGEGLIAMKTFRISNSDNPNTNPIVDEIRFEEVMLFEASAANPQTPSDAGTYTDEDGGAGQDGGKEAYMDGGSEPDSDSDTDVWVDTGLFECKEKYGCMKGAELQAFLTKESFQTYDKVSSEKTVSIEEDPYVSWFVTEGRISRDRSRTNEIPGPFETTWNPPRKGGPSQLWVVAHDMRGGVSWKTYLMEATLPK